MDSVQVVVALEDSKASDRDKDNMVNNNKEVTSLKSLKNSLEAAKVDDQEEVVVDNNKHKGAKTSNFKLR